MAQNRNNSVIVYNNDIDCSDGISGWRIKKLKYNKYNKKPKNNRFCDLMDHLVIFLGPTTNIGPLVTIMFYW